MAGRPNLIAEGTVAHLPVGSSLEVTLPYIVTPSAAEVIRRRQIRILPVPESPAHSTDAGGLLSTCPNAGPGEEARVDRRSAPSDLSAEHLSGFIESTLLDPTATPRQIETLCVEAQNQGFAGVCVNPLFVRQAARCLAGSPTRTISVCGFPLGAGLSVTKAFEAGQAVTDGVDEIDMVMALGLFGAGDFKGVVSDVRAVRQAIGADKQLKVIIEAPLLEATRIVQASLLALEGGADFIKTGTGYRGPARVEDVQLIRRVTGDRARIKAAGGIRDSHTARALIAAGADRLGSSHARELVAPASAGAEQKKRGV